jgi:hypothetical protein
MTVAQDILTFPTVWDHPTAVYIKCPILFSKINEGGDYRPPRKITIPKKLMVA